MVSYSRLLAASWLDDDAGQVAGSPGWLRIVFGGAVCAAWAAHAKVTLQRGLAARAFSCAACPLIAGGVT